MRSSRPHFLIRLVHLVELALALLGAAFLLVTLTPIDNYLLGKLAGPWNDPTGDILIVLGSESMNDVMGLSSYMRSVYAIRAWKQGGFREIVVSGGTSNQGLPVAQQMRDFMVCQGIPTAVIVLEESSLDTHDNAVYTARLLASTPGKKILLTSDYHMFRAYRAFRKAGLAVEPRPFPESSKRTSFWNLRWPVFLDLCLEMSKSAYYYTRGWI